MSSRYLFGGILILLGIGFLIDQFEVISFGELVGTWWPMIIVLIGIYMISQSKKSIFSGVIVLAVGVVFQASELDWLPGNFWGAFWPILLILFGISMLTNIFKKKEKLEVDTDFIRLSAFFSGNEERVSSKNFKGADISAIFGGVTLDLRNAEIAIEGAEITVNAIFGGVDVYVPENVTVVTKGTPLFGGIDNKTNKIYDQNQINPIIKLNYFAMFGGVDIRNRPKKVF